MQLRLLIDEKKKIILDELEKRAPILTSESTGPFIDRLIRKYHYCKGSELHFWKAIKELEQERKIRRCWNGEGKIIFLVKGKQREKKLKKPTTLEKRVKEKRLKIIRDFLLSWKLAALSIRKKQNLIRWGKFSCS